MGAIARIGAGAKLSASEAAKLVKSGMWLDYGFGMGQPDAFDGLAGVLRRPRSWLGGQFGR